MTVSRFFILTYVALNISFLSVLKFQHFTKLCEKSSSFTGIGNGQEKIQLPAMALEQMQTIPCSNRVCNKYCSLIDLLTETSDLPK
jgi:hypothetical protein